MGKKHFSEEQIAFALRQAESLAFARMTGVRVWCNGSMVEAAA